MLKYIHFIIHYVLFLQGEDPTFVMATAGTTVLGAFDQLNEIADVCDKYNIWLHCDVSKRNQFAR